VARDANRPSVRDRTTGGDRVTGWDNSGAALKGNMHAQSRLRQGTWPRLPGPLHARLHARDRLPWIAKYLYVIGCQLLLPALGIESDETPLESEYGTKLVAGPGSFWVNRVLRFRGVWEPVLSEFILRHVQEGDVCVDAGANIGYFSLLFAQRVGTSGKVIAIEARARHRAAAARQPGAQRGCWHRRRRRGSMRRAEGRDPVLPASPQ